MARPLSQDLSRPFTVILGNISSMNSPLVWDFEIMLCNWTTSAGRSGITGDVFLDEDGDGVRDPDEIGVEGVRVNVGARVVRTDSLGRFDLWDLVPFERTVIEIDTLSISNPTWIPAIGPAYIHPTPNSYQPVSLALLQGGEVIGSVEFGETGRGLAGASVLLQHEETGEVTRVLTFSDGTFYVLGLRPGIYEATLPFSLLERMNVSSHPARFLVGTGEEAFVEGVTLRIFENNQDR